MKRKGRLLVAVLFIVMIALPALADDDIGIDGIETRLKHGAAHGYAYYSIEATVRNSGDVQKDVSVMLQGTAGGIEVETAKLRGKIDPNSARVLRGLVYMQSRDYKDINKWKVKKIILHQ